MTRTKRKLKLLCLLGITSLTTYSQTPTGTPPPPFTAPQAASAWYRGGNSLITNVNNIFGTMWNSPIYTHTNNKNRMIVNGDKTATINSYPGQVTDGFVGIGANTALQGFPWNGPAAGPFSLLHLNSGVGGFVQQFGWRPWMKYGITSTHNQDLMFFGQRATGGLDVTDVVIENYL